MYYNDVEEWKKDLQLKNNIDFIKECEVEELVNKEKVREIYIPRKVIIYNAIPNHFYTGMAVYYCVKDRESCVENFNDDYLEFTESDIIIKTKDIIGVNVKLNELILSNRNVEITPVETMDFTEYMKEWF